MSLRSQFSVYVLDKQVSNSLSRCPCALADSPMSTVDQELLLKKSMASSESLCGPQDACVAFGKPVWPVIATYTAKCN